MNWATTLAVVIFGMTVSACAVDKPGDSLQLAQADHAAHKPVVIEQSASVSPDEQTVAETPDAAVTPPEPVERDAKVATEEAARKILDVTLGAAALIKEAGLSAVQAVRESTEAPEAELVVELDEPAITAD